MYKFEVIIVVYQVILRKILRHSHQLLSSFPLPVTSPPGSGTDVPRIVRQENREVFISGTGIPVLTPSFIVRLKTPELVILIIEARKSFSHKYFSTTAKNIKLF